MPLPVVLLGSALALPVLEDPTLFPPERTAADPVWEPEIRVVTSEETPELLGGLVLAQSETVVEAYAGIARVTLHQWFTNPFSQRTEGAYLLPLPDGAILDGAELSCGDQHHSVEAAVVAPQREGKPTSRFLLDEEGVFVWELDALCGEAVAVTVQYVVPLHSEAGRYTLDIAPPPAAVTGLPWETVQPPERSLTVYIDERMPIAGLRSQGESVELAACSHRFGQVASIAPEPGQPISLSWELAGAAAVAYQPAPEAPGYLAITIDPEVLGRLPAPPARELLFVVDSSCSVRGTPYQTAQATILETLEGLTGQDAFNLHPMSAGTPPLFEAPRPVSETTRQAAEDWLRTFSGGSTGGAEGLQAALSAPPTAAHRQLLLLTDGHLDEQVLLAALDEGHSTARIHPVGLGPYANRALLSRIAAEGRGVAIWPEDGEPAEQTAARLAPHLAAPALRDVVIDWGDLEVIEQLPVHTPDMPADAPLRVLARTAPGQTEPVTVRIQGRLSDIPVALELTVPAPDESSEALATLWAGEKIAALSLDSSRDPHTVRDEIIAVALEHGVASRYTALVGEQSTPLTEPEPVLVSTALTALEWSEAPPVALTSPPPRRVPRRKIALSTVGMNLPSGESTGLIIALVDDRQRQIETCYQDRLQYRPDLEGSVAVELEVVDGQLSTIALAENSTGDDWLARCVIRRIQRWEYPAEVTGKLYLPFALSTLD